MDTVSLKPRDILHYICDSEEETWKRRAASENSVTTDLGSNILRECKCIKTTHGLFSSLDRRKCCVSLTSTGVKTSFNNFRVVRSDDHDNGLEEGAMVKSSFDTQPLLVELDAKDFRVFRYAYMCASYPVLGAPDPPSPQTPPLTPPDLGNNRSGFAGFRTQISQTKSEGDVIDETSVVPAETLFELLRRVFRLSQNTFYEYEVYIRNLYGKKDAEPNRILAEEMVGQLVSLENNNNPYYTPKNFMTQFGYDRWQRKEFIHIAELMRKFWHMAHPHKRNNHIQFLLHVHDDYVVLMEKLLRYEATYRQADNTQTTMLSSASVRLLKEFGLRYGVGELFRRIVYLQYLVNNFDPTVWYIQHCIFGVSSVLDVLPNVQDMIRKEVEILSDCIRRLQTTALSTLSKMKSVFPDNKPADGLMVLFDLMDRILEIKCHLKMPKVERLNDMIVQCLVETFPVTYKEMKLVAKTDSKQERSGNLTLPLLNMLIGKIRDEVKHLKTYYQASFQRFCNLAELSAQNLYHLLMEDLQQFFTDFNIKPPSKKINHELLGLGFRLHDLDQDWNLYIAEHPSACSWMEFFYDQSFHILQLLNSQLQEIVINAVGSDNFYSQTFDDVGSVYQLSISSTSYPRDRTISLKSITPSINSAFSGLPSSTSTPVYNNIAWHGQGSGDSHHIPATNLPTKTEQAFKHKLETISLDGTEVHDDHVTSEGIQIFSSRRSCNSLPDKLSKSYDHYLNVSRKALSFSQHIENNKGIEQQDMEHAMDSPENITFELSINNEAEDDKPTVDRNIEDFLPSDDDEQVIDDDQESVESENLNNFSFPPLSEISRNGESDGYFTPPIQKISSPIEPKLVKPVPLIASPMLIDSGSNVPASQREQTLIKPDEDINRTFSSSGTSSKIKKNAILPVSGSSLDVAVILHRLLEFSQTLCMAFIQSNISSVESYKPSTKEMKTRLLNVNLEILCDNVNLYGENILCFDLCGTSNSEAKFLAGPMLMENLRQQRSKDLIWGCRHNLSGMKDCFHYLNRQTDLLSDRYEPVTKDMCTRINNVFFLLECMKTFYKKFRDALSVEGQRLPCQSTEENLKDMTRLNTDCRYLSHINQVQCRILAYRINLFVNDAIQVLLTLKRPSVSIDVCLVPLTQFLQSYLSSLMEWLYTSCYRTVLESLWRFIVRDFEQQVLEVLRGFQGSAEYAKLLIQAFTHLLKFIKDQKKSIRISLLLPEAESMMFKLQLCTTTTRQLITLYTHISDYLTSEESGDFTVQLILQKLKNDLLNKRKCFSGSELVHWIIENQSLIKPIIADLDCPIISPEHAVRIGKLFLEHNLIVDAENREGHDEAPGFDRSLEGIPEDYPDLSIIDNRVYQAHTDSDDSDETPKVPISQPVKLLNTSNRSFKSPFQSLRDSRNKNISLRSRDVQFRSDTPLSFNTMFTESDGLAFENSDKHFYYCSPMAMFQDAEEHETLSEIDILIDQCLQCDVSIDFILHIIYSRRKVDSCSRMFLQKLSPLMLKKIHDNFDIETAACEIS